VGLRERDNYERENERKMKKSIHIHVCILMRCTLNTYFLKVNLVSRVCQTIQITKVMSNKTLI